MLQNAINISNKKMNYIDVGQGYVILFGHSFLWDSDMWQHQIDVMSKKYRCIVPDLWGHGKSEILNDNAVSIDDIANDNLELMDKLGIDKFSIVGLSVGGMWGAHIAVKHPQRIEKLVLCNTDLGKEPLLNKLKYHIMIQMMEKANQIPPALIEKVIPIFFSKQTLENNQELVHYFRNKLSRISQDRIKTIANLARAIFWRDDFLPDLKNIKTQTHIIVGEDDVARPVKESKRLAKLIPNANLSVVSGAGHISAREKPNDFNKILNHFFEE